MPLRTPNTGELELLDKMLKDALSANEDYILRLYSTDFTPTDHLNFSPTSFTESSFTGYAAKTLVRTNWASATVNGSNEAETSFAMQSWTVGSVGGTVFGYYVVASVSGICLWAERFSTPRAMETNDVLNLTPKFTLNTAN